MFRSARLKLTAWYLVIIMIISIGFSLVVYRGFTDQLVRGLRLRQVQIINSLAPVDSTIGIWDPVQGRLVAFEEVYETVRNQVILMLIFMNLAILGLAGAAGYVLSGKTLQPIEAMLERQKQFIADASHELKTPLTVLRSEIEVSLLDKSLSREPKKILKSNLEEVIKMQNLTNYLLALSRYQDNGTPTKSEIFDLKEAVNLAVQKHKKTLLSKKINLKLCKNYCNKILNVIQCNIV